MEPGRAPGPGQRGFCRHCGRALTPHEAWSGGLCGDWRCREAALRRAAEGERAHAAAVLARRAHRSATSGEGAAAATRRPFGGQGRGAFETAPIVVVPWRPSALRPLPTARRRAFVAHLDGLLAELAAGGEASALGAEAARSLETAPGAPIAGTTAAPDPAAAPPDPLLAHVCAACRGACCNAGGTTAFLDRETVLAALGRLDAAEVRATYLGRLPARSVTGSCVFHGASGCGLPRELRAAICNRYECQGLGQARDARERGAEVVHVVRREDQMIHDSAFVDARGLDTVVGTRRPGPGIDRR